MRLDQEQTLYVDAAAAAGGDGSEAKPFKTIQAAINARYRGAPVIYIKIKAGTYSEDIKTPRAPNTTWRLMKNGTGVVTINTAIIDNCNYVVFDSLTFKGGAVANSTIIYIANTASANFNNVTVNGNANLTGIHFATSRGVLNNTQLNNCGLAIAASESSTIDLRNTSGTGNVRGVYADGTFVTVSGHTIQANTQFERINGGGITAEGGASSIPSNYAQLYKLGDFTTVAALQAAILAELGKLDVGESRACYFGNNMPEGYGPFASTQRMQAYITKSTNYGNGYGTVFFRSHHDAPAAYQQIQDGYFAQPTPVKFITNSDMASPTAYGLVRVPSAEDEINCTCNDAAVTPEVLYKVANFRKVSTAYSVGDTVGCAYHNGMQLECITAGTTSTTALDTHDVQTGDIITDGGVQWKVRSPAGVPVGFEYYQTNPNIQAGSLPFLGGEYSRATYADLWAWVQTQPGYLITEAEWQAKAAANGGAVPFYSSGDGTTTFRVPALNCWVKGASGLEEIGGYLAAGLPNIAGELDWSHASDNYTGMELLQSQVVSNGALSVTKTRTEQLVDDASSRISSAVANIAFDAANSNQIYGNSETVQPPTIVGLWCVKAYGTVTNVGATDVADIAQGLTELETRVRNTVDIIGDINTMAELDNLRGTHIIGGLFNNDPMFLNCDYNGISIDLNGQITQLIAAAEPDNGFFYRMSDTPTNNSPGQFTPWLKIGSDLFASSGVGTATGYRKFSDGCMEVWGRGTTMNTITFPSAFKTVELVLATKLEGSSYEYTVIARSWTTTNFYLECRNSENSTRNYQASYRAWGTWK